MADREADAYLRLLAEIMGVEEGETANDTRKSLEEALGVTKPGPIGAAMGDAATGHHPKGRLSTVEELVIRYRSGELKDSYELPLADGSGFGVWFTDGEYDSEDGFHPQAHSYEFTKLWYQIMGEELDLKNCGEWTVAHGGLRWEYYGGATCGDLRGEVEAIFDHSNARYQAVYAALADGELKLPTDTSPDPTPSSEWDADEWSSLLDDE